MQCDAAGLGVAACVFAMSGCLLNSRMHKDARKSWNFPEWESTETVHAPLAPQALETGDFGIVEPIL